MKFVSEYPINKNIIYTPKIKNIVSQAISIKYLMTNIPEHDKQIISLGYELKHLKFV